MTSFPSTDVLSPLSSSSPPSGLATDGCGGGGRDGLGTGPAADAERWQFPARGYAALSPSSPPPQQQQQQPMTPLGVDITAAAPAAAVQREEDAQGCDGSAHGFNDSGSVETDDTAEAASVAARRRTTTTATDSEGCTMSAERSPQTTCITAQTATAARRDSDSSCCSPVMQTSPSSPQPAPPTSLSPRPPDSTDDNVASTSVRSAAGSPSPVAIQYLSAPTPASVQTILLLDQPPLLSPSKPGSAPPAAGNGSTAAAPHAVRRSPVDEEAVLAAWTAGRGAAAAAAGGGGLGPGTQQRLMPQQLHAVASSRKRRASGDSYDSCLRGPVDAASSDTRDEDEDIDDDDDDDVKMQTTGVDQDRFKAFNLFVRLFIDENLDRMVPISKQPKDKVQAIIEACDRQFAEFHDRARKRIRTYLKSCRRMRRCKDANGVEQMRPTPPHLTSAMAETILATACENESINAKRMRMGLEPLPASYIPAAAQSTSPSVAPTASNVPAAARPAAGLGDALTGGGRSGTPCGGGGAAGNTMSVPSKQERLSPPTSTVGATAAAAAAAAASSQQLAFAAAVMSGLAGVDLVPFTSNSTSGMPGAGAARRQTGYDIQTLFGHQALNGTGPPVYPGAAGLAAVATGLATGCPPLTLTGGYPAHHHRQGSSTAASQTGAGSHASVGTGENKTSSGRNSQPSQQNGPTDLSVKKSLSAAAGVGSGAGGMRGQLNALEIATVRQLIAGYRESASFLYRSADELEQLLLHQH